MWLQLYRSAPGAREILERLNGQWHRRALQVYLVIVLAHWIEHLLQAFQIWGLGWHRAHSLGALGLLFPWLAQSEWLHYGYALIMLIGLIILRPAFQGRSLWLWNLALIIQFWHHFEHALLLGQVLTGRTLFGSPGPVSVLQLMFPRVELHLFYNAVVFVPMLLAMIYHRYPPAAETHAATCTCARHRKLAEIGA